MPIALDSANLYQFFMKLPIIVGCVNGSVTHRTQVNDALRLSPNTSCIGVASH